MLQQPRSFSARRAPDLAFSTTPPDSSDNDSLQRVRSRSDAFQHNNRITVTSGESYDPIAQAKSRLHADIARLPSFRGHLPVNRDLYAFQAPKDNHIEAQLDVLSTTRSSSYPLSSLNATTANLGRPRAIHVRSAPQLELQHPSPQRISPLLQSRHIRTDESAQSHQKPAWTTDVVVKKLAATETAYYGQCIPNKAQDLHHH